MGAVFTKLIEQLNTSVFVLLVVLCACFWIVYHVGKWAETFSNHSKRIDAAEGNHGNLYEKVVEMKSKVDLIYTNTLKNPPTMAHSPISLTEVGRDGNSNIGLDSILRREYDLLSDLVNKKLPKNAYDIQVESMRVADEQFQKILTESELIKAKDFAFEKGLRLEDLSSILGVLLRNEILKKKGVPIADVDAHAPKSSN
ncbi:MAG: hypothetical protein WJ306_13325 [Ferrovum myxofaciens]